MRFSKMQGIGNDFVVVDSSRVPDLERLPALAISLCDRHRGIGADGLLVLRQIGEGAAFEMRMFNPDGTEDMCGNGLRCAVLWALRAGWIRVGQPVTVATREGPKSAALLDVDSARRTATVRIGMGLPKFDSPDIPFAGPVAQVRDYPLPVGDEIYPITALNTGSTHTVIFCDTPPDELTFQRVSPVIELHPLFPERTTVLWATPQHDGVIDIRIWERSVGETLGCGTGASAAGVAALAQTAGSQTTVLVRSAGGTLEIEWPGMGEAVTMTGPAEYIFDGEFVASYAPLSEDPRETEL